MNKAKLIAAGLVTVLAALAGEAPAASRHSAGRHLNDPPLYPILKDCPRMVVRAKVRIKLGENLNPAKPARDIVDDDDPTMPIPKPGHPYPDATPLDFDLSNYLTPEDSPVKISAVAIKIVLKDQNYAFKGGADAIGSPYQDGMFCGLEHLDKDGNSDPKGNVLRFHALYVKALPHPYVGQFDIGLKKHGFHPFSVYVDPHVGNTGLDLAALAKKAR